MLSQRGATAAAAAAPMGTTGHWQHHQQRLHHQLCTNCTPDIFICCEGYQTRVPVRTLTLVPSPPHACCATCKSVGSQPKRCSLSLLTFSETPSMSGDNPVTPVKALIDINRVIYDHCNGCLRLRVSHFAFVMQIFSQTILPRSRSKLPQGRANTYDIPCCRNWRRVCWTHYSDCNGYTKPGLHD